MRFIRAFMLTSICLAGFSWGAAPAFAWYWPIMGDIGPCPGSPCVGGASPILPGTPQWALQPTCGAYLLPFGYPYGAIQGCLSFGITPPFGFPCSGFPGTTGPGFIGK